MTYAHHNWFAEVEGPTGTTRSSAPYQTNFFVIDEHCGTHFDAPTHFVPPPVTGEYPGWPAPAPETDFYLHERGVKTIGIDAPSIGSAHDGVPVHQEGLSRGMRYVEILTNLGELPVRGACFIFMPVKIANSSGGPGRAMALIGEA
jgi:kynurenine formamidase